MKIVAQKENEKEAEILEKYSPVYTRFCTNCGSPLEYDSVFCSECGNKIEEFDEEIAKNQKISGNFQRNSDDDKEVKRLVDSEFDDIDKFREAIKNDRRVILKNEKQKKGKKRK